ncbi:MAG: hypothetical protein NTY95_10560 [Bacteroidia bacterium]|nr:hypothetical protein [Bacteroidia bacterium]
MKISKILYYGGARAKICRLGLSHLFLELQDILLSTQIYILREKQKNSAGVVRERIDYSFECTNKDITNNDDKWIKSSSGDIDWKRRYRFNTSIVPWIGVEIQVSARSDLLARDIVHIRNSLQESRIDMDLVLTHYLKRKQT